MTKKPEDSKETEEQKKEAPPLDPEAEREKLCIMLYGIFAAGLVMQFINLTTIILGSAAVLAGIILAYLERKKAAGTLHGNHLQWIIRTFWIGGAVYLPILTVIGMTILVFTIDPNALVSAMSTGERTIDEALQEMLYQNKGLIYITMYVITAPFGIWWLWRCWYGYKLLKEGKNILNPQSWV